MSWLLLILISALMAILPASSDGDSNDASLTVSEIIEQANANAYTHLVHGDIAPVLARNADPCTAKGCKWPKKKRLVKVPYKISTKYSKRNRKFIRNALKSFHKVTCIRFIKKRKAKNYLDIISGNGCWSYIGRLSGKQQLSLMENGCLYKGIVQHEILHALGFHHEQSRSDRDDHIEVVYENIRDGMAHNFDKEATNNLKTPYDFTSVMQYSNTAFSKNGKPTLVAKSDPDLKFGFAEEMSANDINRINKLYKCNM